MAEIPTEQTENEGHEEDPCKQRTSTSGQSKFSRMGKDESIGDWLKSKEEKRSKPASKGLARRTGLCGGGALKKTRLNPVSKKQKKKNNEYNKAKKVHYADEANRVCLFCGTSNNLSIHHTAKRLNGKLMDETSFITLCLAGDFMDRKHPDSNHSHTDGCHGWLEANKSWARDNGYII